MQQQNLGSSKLLLSSLRIGWRSYAQRSGQAAASWLLPVIRFSNQFADLVLGVRIAGKQVKANRADGHDDQNDNNSDHPAAIGQPEILLLIAQSETTEPPPDCTEWYYPAS